MANLTKNKSLVNWMTPLINSFTDDGAIPYLLNTKKRYRASPLASTIIWLDKAGLLSPQALEIMQNKLLFLRDECQENDPIRNYEKYDEDKDGWSLAEGVSIWSTSLSLIALFDNTDSGIKQFAKFKGSILWLANQQDINNNGWAYQSSKNCDVNEITSALAMQALAKVYRKIEQLNFDRDEKKILLRTLTTGFQYLKDACIKSKRNTYWHYNGVYSLTATTWILVALSELCHIPDMDNEVVEFYKENKQKCFRYILSKMPNKEQKWTDEQIVSEAGAKYGKQKNYYSFTPALLSHLLDLGLSPYEPKITKQIKWLIENPTSWKISKYDKGEICTFNYAMVITTIVTWIRSVGLCLAPRLLHNPKSIIQKAKKLLAIDNLNGSNVLIINKNILILLIIILVFPYFKPLLIMLINKANFDYTILWNEILEKENKTFFLSVIASIVASIIIGIIMLLPQPIVAIAKKIFSKSSE